MEDVIQLYEILCNWSESGRGGRELVEVRLSVTRSNSCKGAEALEQRV